MNNRKRQIAKVLRAQERREKEVRARLAQDKFMNAVSDVIRAGREMAARIADAFNELLDSDGVRELLDTMKRYKETNE